MLPKAVTNMFTKFNNKSNESGAALAMAIIILAILSVIALTALAFSSSEARIAGSDLQRDTRLQRAQSLRWPPPALGAGFGRVHQSGPMRG